MIGFSVKPQRGLSVSAHLKVLVTIDTTLIDLLTMILCGMFVLHITTAPNLFNMLTSTASSEAGLNALAV